MSDKVLRVTLEADDQLTIAIDKAKKATDELKKSSDAASKGIKGMGAAAVEFAAVTYVFNEAKQLLGDVIDVASDLIETFERLDDVQDGLNFHYGPEQGSAALKDVIAYAEKAGIGLEEAEDEARLLGQSFTHPEAVAGYFKNLHDLATEAGLTSEKTRALFDEFHKLAEADSPRKVAGAWEGLRSTLGTVADQAATALGKTPEELIQGIKKGTITVQQLDEALLAVGQRGRELGENTVQFNDKQVGPQLQKIQLGWQELKLQLAESLLTPETVKDLKGFADDWLKFVHDPETKKFFDEVKADVTDPAFQDGLKAWSDDALNLAKSLRDSVAAIKELVGYAGKVHDAVYAPVNAFTDAVVAPSETLDAQKRTLDAETNLAQRVHEANVPKITYDDDKVTKYPSHPAQAPAHASGGLVTGIVGGQAIVAAPGEGLASVGKGETIVPDSSPAQRYSPTADAASAQSPTSSNERSDRTAAGGMSIDTVMINIDLSHATTNEVLSDHARLRSAIERGVRDAFQKFASAAQQQG